MILKRIAPFSLAKISGVLYSVIGFFVGCVFAFLSLIGAAFSKEATGGAFGAIFGVGAIVMFPILYGVMGFIGCLISAAIYNVLASWVGGVEVELVPKPGSAPSMPDVVPTPHA